MENKNENCCKAIGLLLLACLAMAPFHTYSQIKPAENSTLHHLLTGFSFPTSAGQKYILEIADGSYDNDRDFSAHTIKKITVTSGRVVTELPFWGRPYTWRYSGVAPHGQPAKSELHHFVTGTTNNIDTQGFRLTILKKATLYQDAAVFCDNSRVLYNMNGKALWYLPNSPGMWDEHADIRDMKLSSRGTITFTTNSMAYEIDYDGEVLWQAPNNGKVSGDQAENYHHELTILGNTNYMVLGNEYLPYEWKKNGATDSTLSLLPKSQPQGNTGEKKYPKMSFGTVIEYDTNSNIIWSWKSSDYFKQSGLLARKTTKSMFDTHENSFFFDEKRKNVFVSFKNISQVLKIKYPEGNVVAVYGNGSDSIMPQGSMFCHQHSCKVTKTGYLYVFNNNICHPAQTPTIIVMEEPTATHAGIKKIWEYTYPYKGDFTEAKKANGTSGGNVMALPGDAFFASMCSPYANIFIVGHDKKLLWDAVIEKWNVAEKKWQKESCYRASIITNPKNLEHLVWGEDIPGL